MADERLLCRSADIGTDGQIGSQTVGPLRVASRLSASKQERHKSVRRKTEGTGCHLPRSSRLNSIRLCFFLGLRLDNGPHRGHHQATS